MTRNELTWQAAAAANLRAAQKRHSRLGKPKSRNGCLTCKARRVKCDEARPECSRCRAAGRACDGYAESSSSKSPSPTSSVESPLSPSPELQDGERRQLDFFVSCAAAKIGGSFDKDFWCGSVLQVAQHEPVILDCLLAISTLYEHPQYVTSFRSNAETRQSAFELVKQNRAPASEDAERPVDANHAKALKLYNRAIRRLNKRLNADSSCHVLALVSCILFVCIETIRDHVHTVMFLYKNGIDMLNQWHETTTTNDESSLLLLVRRMFMRLGVLAASFAQPASALLKLDNSLCVFKSVFRDLAEARLELFTLLAESNAFTLDSNTWRNAIFDSTQWREDGSHHLRKAARIDEIASLFADLQARCAEHMEKLSVWRQMFEPLRLRGEPTQTGSVNYLLMIYYTWLIWIPTRLSCRKTAFDAYTDQFRELLNHAEVFLNHHTSERPVFTFEFGAIPSMYWVACECRVPSLRRKALALLRKAPKKESFLGADSSAEVAYRQLVIEERDLRLPDPAELDENSDGIYVDDSVLPAEDKRVHFMELVNTTPVFKIRVTMLVEKDGYFHWVVEDIPV